MPDITSENIEELRSRLSKELHILIVMISGAWGGLEQTALADVRMLMQNGFKVTLLVRKGSPIEKVIQQESPQIRLRYSPEAVRNYFDSALWRLLHELVDKEGVNLVHCHQTSILGAVVPPLMRRPHVAIVVSRHILNSHNKKDPLHALLYRRVDYILVLSQTMKRNLLTTFPVPEKKLRIVNLSIDLERFNPNLVDRETMREEWGLPKNAFVIGIVGRLDPMKGQDLLIKALAQVQKTLPNAYGVMVGDETPGLDGKYLAELSHGVEQLKLGDRVIVSKASANVPAVMAAFDVFVMPSWSEAFGLVALEAMAMGVPCILSRSGSAEEVAISSGAEVMRPRDAYDLARKIIYLHNSPEIRVQMKKNGRSFVTENHGKPVRLFKTLEVYNRCYRRRIRSEL